MLVTYNLYSINLYYVFDCPGMKRILFLLAIVFLAHSSMAQKKIVYGLTGGMSLSGLSSERYEEMQRKAGCYLGLWAEYPIRQGLWLQSGLMYATCGADVLVYSVPYSVDVEYDLDYLQLPLVGICQMDGNLYLEFGPSFNLLVRQKGYRPGLPDIIDQDGTVGSQSDIDPGANRVELSILAGLSYRLNQTWTIRARYTRGLTNTFESSSARSATKNDAIQFGVSYTIKRKLAGIP